MRKLTEIIRTQLQEGLTNYMGVIDSDHAYIHKGIAYKAIIQLDSQSATYRIGFTTPATDKYIHWRPAGIGTSETNVRATLTEGDTYTSGATLTPVNLNRNFADGSSMQTFSIGVTATPTGTVIQAMETGGGSGGNATGGGTGSNEERLLAPDTDYVMTIEPSGSTNLSLELFWYEEEGWGSI